MSLSTTLASSRVLDLSIGMAGALVSKFLVEAGASVVRIEPLDGDPFYDVYPAYRHWHKGKTVADVATFSRHLGTADICIVGGEDFPGVVWRHDPQDLLSRFPKLVVITIDGYAAPLEGVPDIAVDLLVQASMGLVFERYDDRPIYHTIPDPTYGAVLLALLGGLAAVWERERSGLGQVVSTSLQQGTLIWRAMQWYQASGASGRQLAAVPKAARQLICRCADGFYIQFTRGGRGAALRVNNILGIHDETVTVDTPPMSATAEPRDFFGDLDTLNLYVAKWQSDDLLRAFRENGITAELVLAPGDCWTDPQVLGNQILVADADGSQRVGFPISTTSIISCAPTRPACAPAAAPLAGIKIVDLGSYIAGPSASRFLGDFGADVIKVEPKGGDPVRLSLPNFACGNRGKRSIALDLKTPEGVEIVRRLCLEADIVQHNFRPEIARRLGVDAATIQSLKKETIVLETTGYGIAGPKSAYPGFDMVLQALCGHEQRLGGTGNPPEWNRLATVDTATGMLGAIALLLALMKRADAGESLSMDVNLLNTGLFLISELVCLPDGSFAGAPANNSQQTGVHPAEQLYQARGGWIAVAARTDEMAADMVAALGLAECISRPRAQWDESEGRQLADAISRCGVAEILTTLSKAGVWAVECRDNAEQYFLMHPKLESIAAVIRTDDRRMGETRQIGSCVQLSRSPLCTVEKSSVSQIGEDARAILTDLGYRPDEIAGLYERAIIV